MAVRNKKFRFLYWFLKDLFKRYRKSLIIGFGVGLLATIIIGRLTPIVIASITKPIERIGIVGEIRPESLPLSIQSQISYGLTRLAPDGSLLPGIAASWSYEQEGKEIVFILSDLSWHNGEQLKASDINYNIEGVTFQAINSNTLKAILPEPYSPFLTVVSKPVFRVGLVGIGDYKVSTLKLKGDQIETLKLTPVVNTKLPEKEYIVYRTENQALYAYKRGDIDSIEELSNIESINNWGNIIISENPNFARVIAIYFNMSDQLMNEKQFRQGLAYALPKINEEQANSPIPKNSWAYSNAVRTYTYDEAQAKKLFDTIKLPDDFSGITLTTFPQYVTVAQQIANQWTSLGITTTVKVENSIENSFQILLSAQDLPPDPDQYPFWHSKQEATNITNYVNVRVDKLLEDGRREMDQEKRKKLYADFQKYLMEDLPVIFLYHPKTYTVSRN